jgi:hypothetical protein
MNKLTLTDQEVFIVLQALHAITIKGSDAPTVGALVSKFQTELDKVQQRMKEVPSVGGKP